MCNIPHAHSTGLSSSQFSRLKSAGIDDAEKSNTEVKYWTSFTAQTRNLKPVLLLRHFFIFSFFSRNKDLSIFGISSRALDSFHQL
jgi:hypothetical protein